MANVWKVKHSSTPGHIPLNVDLEVSELAINLADRIIYSKDAGGNIISFNLGGGSESAATIDHALVLGYPDKPTDAEEDWTMAGYPFTLDTVVAKAKTPPVLESVFTVWNNEDQIGTITFATGASIAVSSLTGFYEFTNHADELTLVAPATADVDLSNIQFLFKGTRSGVAAGSNPDSGYVFVQAEESYAN